MIYQILHLFVKINKFSVNFIGGTTMSKGTVYKRRDGRWECRISMGKDDNGKHVWCVERGFDVKTLSEILETVQK